MKKLLVSVLSLCLVLALFAGCGKEEKTTLTVFAAASMTETLTQLGEAYMEEHGNVEILFNFDSSGTLKTQIQEGAECDVFISAGQKQMDGLEDALLEGTRFDILENKVALAVPRGNPAGITSYDELVAGLKEGSILLAMGNSDVPVGQYTQKIFAYYGLDEASLAQNLTYGSNVKEVTTQVSEASVDCGIIYETDAFSAGLEVVDTARAEMCGQVVYPAAVLKNASQAELAGDFLEFLCSAEADAVFAAVGFTPLG